MVVDRRKKDVLFVVAMGILQKNFPQAKWRGMNLLEIVEKKTGISLEDDDLESVVSLEDEPIEKTIYVIQTF